MDNAKAALADYRALRCRAFCWREGQSAAVKALLAVGMAAFTGLMAQVRFPLPFTPVPVTGQVFAVLLAGVLLGRYYGGLSQVIYVALGVAGVPWFSGLARGTAVLLGPTGGYLVGFVLAAELIGAVSERNVAMRGLWPQLGLMLLGVAVIYACGLLHLLALGTGIKWGFLMGVAPFLGVDAAKAVVAAHLSTALLPKAPARGEVDAGRGR